MAILGNAAGTTARAYGRLFPATRIDGVELDSELSDIGRRYFDMHNPRLTMHHEDARPFLRRVDTKLRRDRGGRLPPALHPLLPDHRGVLRPGARPADPRRRGDHQRGPARGRDQAGARAHRRPAQRARRTWSATRSRTPTRCWWRAARRCRRRGCAAPRSARLAAARGAAAATARATRRAGWLAAASGLRGRGDAYTDDRAPVEWLVDKSIVDYAAGDDESGGQLGRLPGRAVRT